MSDTDTDPAGEPVQTTVAALVESLVSFESENPPGAEADCAAFVVDWLEERGVDAERVYADGYPDRPSVGARVGSGDGPSVVLNGHIDVVPAGDPGEWTTPAYEPEVREGRLYGRGSADMKSGVAVAMHTMASLAPEFASGDLSGELVFHAAMGEETAEPGTRSLLEAGYTGDYGVCLEPTELRTATSEKGLAWYEITVKGDPSHASQPDAGVNAIGNARPVLDALERYDAEVREREDDLVGCAYATVTKFEAGTKENVVPESAVVTIDRRFLPAESAAEIDAEIDALLAEVTDEHGVEVSWERTRTYESAAVPEDCRAAAAFRDAAEAVAGVRRDPWGVKASTDVRNLVNDAGVEAVTWGPGTLDEAHTYDESIAVEEVRDGREALERAVRDLLGE